MNDYLKSDGIIEVFEGLKTPGKRFFRISPDEINSKP